LGILIISIAMLGCMQKFEINQPVFPSRHEEVKVIEIKRLTYDEAQDTSPTWNPDGKQIAFASKRTGRYSIWIMDADGKNLRILDPKTLHLSGYENNPSWSKGGIVFESSRAGNLDIWLMDSEGNSVRLTADENCDALTCPIDMEPSWSPDGKWIAFSSIRNGKDFDIWIMDADGKNLRRLTNDSVPDRMPSWSPDGKQIAFASKRNATNEFDFDIWIMDADGSNLTQLTRSPSMDIEPSWSPDGKWIAFASADEPMKFDIWITKVDGSSAIRLTTNESIDRHPRWKGNEIVFTSTRSGGGDIYVLKLES